METSAGMARAPFRATIGVKACACTTPVLEAGRARTIDRAVARIEGYWNVYIGFFGDQVVWMNFDVVDVRTGQVVWRNGRYTATKERADALITREAAAGEPGGGTGAVGDAAR